MKRCWPWRLRLKKRCRRSRPEFASKSCASRRLLRLEPLEDRALLAADSAAATDSGSRLLTDANHERAGALIVQFRSGVTSPASLAAYSDGHGLGQAWDVAQIGRAHV